MSETAEPAPAAAPEAALHKRRKELVARLHALLEAAAPDAEGHAACLAGAARAAAAAGLVGCCPPEYGTTAVHFGADGRWVMTACTALVRADEPAPARIGAGKYWRAPVLAHHSAWAWWRLPPPAPPAAWAPALRCAHGGARAGAAAHAPEPGIVWCRAVAGAAHELEVYASEEAEAACATLSVEAARVAAPELERHLPERGVARLALAYVGSVADIPAVLVRAQAAAAAALVA